MAAHLNPYITFDGNAREAMEFYERVFGGELTISTFGEYGADGEQANGVMHANLETDRGFNLMASDTAPGSPHNPGDNIAISLSGMDGEDGDDLRRWWQQLSEEGTVTMPLEKQMWGDEFGMCVDRFGIGWMVNIGQQQQ